MLAGWLNSDERVGAQWLLVLLPALLLVGSVRPGFAHIGHLGGAFHAETLAKACELARSESKLIFLYVSEPGARGIGYLERPTWRDDRLMHLLVCETVIATVARDAEPELLSRLGIEQVPAVYLLTPGLEVHGQWPGRPPAARLLSALLPVLSDDDAVARAHAALRAKGADDYFSRERLARALARGEAHDEATREFRWCLETSVRIRAGLPAVRRRVLFKRLAEYVAEHPPTKALADETRREVEALLLGERDDPVLARDLAELNCHLRDDARSLALFDKLPPERLARHGLFDRVCAALIEQRRYAEVLALIEPLAAFREEAALTRQPYRILSAPPADRLPRGTRGFAVERGILLVEVLVGVGRAEDAQRLLTAILRFDNRLKTWRMLRERVAKWGDEDLLLVIDAKAPAAD